MRTKRTAEEVRAEIEKLKACKQWAPKRSCFGDDNHHNIDLQIEFLTGDLDTTSEEFEELDDSERSAVLEAESWFDGSEEEESPSSGWPKPK